LNKYLKCSVWRLALRYDIYIYIYIVRLQKVKTLRGFPELLHENAGFNA